MTTLRWCSQALVAVTILSFMVMLWSSNWSPFTAITSLLKASQDQPFSAQNDGSINSTPPIADNARPSSSPDRRGDDLSSGYGTPSTIADVKAPPSSSTPESHGDDLSFGYGASSSSANDLALPSSSSESYGDYLREHAGEVSPSPSPPSPDLGGNPYHNWQPFRADFSHMLKRFRVFIYPHAYNPLSPFANVFLPTPNPKNPKSGNYFSEHIFKISLLNSSFITREASQAHFFFLPFSINALRNDPRMRGEDRIAAFVAAYVQNVSRDFEFWNRTSGADHFYACCHSVGRTAASQTPSLQRNSVQVVCSSNYFLRGYAPHKDIAMPQVWPRPRQLKIWPPQNRTRLAFYAGRTQNSEVRQRLVGLWKNDTDLDIYAGKVTGSYEEAFQRTKFCLHVKGYEVNTARIADAIHYGCVPVIISNHYDLPFANVLDWKKFSIIISQADLSSLKSILMSVTEQQYIALFENVCKVRKHFQWQDRPSGYDAFHMTMYQLWLRRGFVSPLQNSLDSALF